MTDLEKIELSIRRTAQQYLGFPDMFEMLTRLAEQIVQDEMERKDPLSILNYGERFSGD